MTYRRTWSRSPWPSVDCRLPVSMTHDVSSYLVQQYMTQCSPQLFDSLWQSCLCRHVLEMSRHKVANFVLQTVITRLHTQQQVVFTYWIFVPELTSSVAVCHVCVVCIFNVLVFLVLLSVFNVPSICMSMFVAYCAFVKLCQCKKLKDTRAVFACSLIVQRQGPRCTKAHSDVVMVSCQISIWNLLLDIPPQPFYGPFPGPPRWVSARRELLDFMVQGEINRGRHTDHPAGRHNLWTNRCPPPPSPHIFLQDGYPSCRPTNSVKALKATWYNGSQKCVKQSLTCKRSMHSCSSSAVKQECRYCTCWTCNKLWITRCSYIHACPSIPCST